MTRRIFIPLAFIAAALALPFAAAAQVAGSGLSSCNQTGAYAMSVGSLQAVGGSFVPVSDNAVTLNTGYLVYLDCVLRPLTAAEAHQVTYQYTQSELQQYLTGNNGNPYFVTNYPQQLQTVGANAFNGSLSGVVGNLNSAFQSTIQTALARNYALSTNNPSISLACPYGGNLSSVLNGTTNDLWGGISAMLNPSCSPYSAYTLAQNQLYANAAAAQNAWLTQANWGNGSLPITDANGNVVTPGFLVSRIALQATLSGQQTAQNATDLGQLVNGFVAGLANQVLSAATGGIASLNSSINGRPSYLSQAAAATTQALGQAVTNTALQTLGPALQAEQQYNQIQNSLAGSLTQTIAQLRGEESECWQLIIQNVCSASSTPSTVGSGTTCTGTNGATLHITTPVAFSQPIIDTQIAALANQVAQNATASQQSINAIQELIAGAENSADTSAQANAINQLNALVANGQLQSQNDVSSAKAELDPTNSSGLVAQMQTLVTNTTNSWTGYDASTGTNDIPWNGSVPSDSSPNAGQGWCDVPTSGAPTAAQQQTLSLWIQAWSK